MRIIGHESVRKRLADLAGSESCPRSYLLTGPDRIGKRLVAYEFAGHLMGSALALGEEGRPTNIDVFTLHPKEKIVLKKKKTASVTVEQIREGLVFLSRYPTRSRARVLIIEGAESLSDGAQNALLKTLEEPNDTSFLILVASGRRNLLPTVLSRVQSVPLSLVPEETLRRAYPRGMFPAAVPELYYALGRPGLFEDILAHPERMERERSVLTNLFRIGSLSLCDRYALAEELSGDGSEAQRYLTWWSAGLRAAVRRAKDEHGIRSFYSLIEAISETSDRLEKSGTNVRLQLERLFLRVL